MDRWAALRTNAFATSNLLARVDQLAALLEQPQQRNFTRWPILGTTVTPNHFVGTNYADEVRFLKTWLGGRLDWMDKQFVPAPLLSTVPVAEQCRLELASAAPPGKIYYTLDGTDPRAPGGEPAAQARLYATPVTCPNTGRVTARIRLDTRWSAPRFAQLR